MTDKEKQIEEMAREFEKIIENTRKYIDYVENHYNNVQKAFAEFARRINKAMRIDKYREFITRTGLSTDYSCNVLEGIIKNHDLSKLGKEEFTQYRDNFFPLNEEAKNENKEDFEKAWEHHKQNNRHHWQARDINTPRYTSFDLDDLFAIENVMDWIAMAYAFNETPINKYYLENKHKMQLSVQDEMIIEDVYSIMLDKDLEV